MLGLVNLNPTLALGRWIPLLSVGMPQQSLASFIPKQLPQNPAEYIFRTLWNMDNSQLEAKL